MIINSASERHGYLLCLLATRDSQTALLQASVSCFPLERAATKHRRRPYPTALLLADMGSTGRARRGLSWLKREMAERWVAQDGWLVVPNDDGRAFRRLMFTAVDRYGAYEANKSLQSIDLVEFSTQRAASHHMRTKRTAGFAPIPTETVES